MTRLGLLALLLASSAFAQTTVETQEDGNVSGSLCSTSPCIALNAGNTDVRKSMDEGATAGSTEDTATHPAATNDELIAQFSDTGGLGVDCDSGTATVRWNVTTGNTNFTFTTVCVCQGSTTLGAATGLSISGSAGVKTQDVSINSSTGCNTGSVQVSLGGDVGGAHGNESIGITPDQDIDIPTVAGAEGRRRSHVSVVN